MANKSLNKRKPNIEIKKNNLYVRSGKGVKITPASRNYEYLVFCIRQYCAYKSADITCAIS
jgi:hypothetical protein